MGKMQKLKGGRGEREAAKALMEMFDIEIHRGRQYSGGKDSPDIKGLERYGLHCEVKRDEFTISKRVANDLDKRASIGLYKGESVVIVPLSDIFSKHKYNEVKLTKSLINALCQAENDSGELVPFVMVRRNHGVWYVCVRSENYALFMNRINKLPIKNTARK